MFCIVLPSAGGRKGATDDITRAKCVIIAGQNNNLDGQAEISLKQIDTLGTDNTEYASILHTVFPLYLVFITLLYHFIASSITIILFLFVFLLTRLRPFLVLVTFQNVLNIQQHLSDLRFLSVL